MRKKGLSKTKNTNKIFEFDLISEKKLIFGVKVLLIKSFCFRRLRFSAYKGAILFIYGRLRYGKRYPVPACIGQLQIIVP